MKTNQWKIATLALLVLLCVVMGVIVVRAATRNHYKSAEEFSACKEDLRETLRNSIATGAQGGEPDSCQDFTDEEINRLVNEVMEEEFTR